MISSPVHTSLRVSSFLSLVLALALLSCDNRTVGEDTDGSIDQGNVGGDGPKLDRGVKPPGDLPRPDKSLAWPDYKLKPDQMLKPDKKLPPDSKLPPKDTGPKPCNVMGKSCNKDKDCCSSMICSTSFAGARMCTQACTPDNKKTPLVNEDNCPGTPNKFICANIASPPAKTYRCLQRCVPTKGKNTCADGLACRPKSTWMTLSVDRAVCGFPMCKTAGHCPVYLSKLCSPGSPLKQCVGFPAGTFCAPHYPGSFGGRCAMLGVCDIKSGNCVAHNRGKKTAKVGDPCTDDRDCGGQMECNMEVATSGMVYFRNGYCSVEGCVFAATLPDRKCPTGSACLRTYYSGRCLKTCDLQKATGCRGYAKDKHGDYECRAWNLYPTGKPNNLCPKPVCEAGYASACTLFAGTKITCANLGLPNNPTQMDCREVGSGKILSHTSPYGICLDTTSSGK